MDTTKLYQNHIKDIFEDAINTASMLIGFECEGGTLLGDEIGDATYYDITIVENISDVYRNIEISAFNKYFKKNYGKRKDRFYFDSPHQALAELIKAWYIWNKHLSTDVRNKYIQTEIDFHQSFIGKNLP